MERIRGAGIIKIDDGIAFIHRVDVKKQKKHQNYYTIPGGGIEENETPEEGTIREIKEELGINVKIVEKIYETYIEKFNQKEIYYLCEYIDGEFGTGKGPEFTYNPLYEDCGKYIPEIIKKEEIEKIFLLPQEVKEMIIKNIKEGKI